jgi:DNA-binding NarL/FixJ family response regulator
MRQTVILLAEDEPDVRRFLAFALKEQDFSVLPACNAHEALDIFHKQPADFLLTDLELADGMNGLDLAEQILKEQPETKALLISGSPDSEALAAERGLPFLGKPFLPATLIGKIRQLLGTKIRRNAKGAEALTMREQEVLALVAEGCRTKDIATRLGISFKTAASHRSRIMDKFGVHNVVVLLRLAIRKGLIQP